MGKEQGKELWRHLCSSVPGVLPQFSVFLAKRADSFLETGSHWLIENCHCSVLMCLLSFHRQPLSTYHLGQRVFHSAPSDTWVMEDLTHLLRCSSKGLLIPPPKSFASCRLHSRMCFTLFPHLIIGIENWPCFLCNFSVPCWLSSLSTF